VRITLCCGDIPDVLKKCACLEGLGDYIEECGMKEIAVAHADLNYFTSRTSVIGPYLSYAEVTDLVANITRELKDKAIVQYLGGDNLAVVTNKDHLKEVVDVITSKDNIKVGVGISKYPRKAFELAAQALKVLRDEGRTRSYHILLDK
jgi:GTP cyclohydrolase III